MIQAKITEIGTEAINKEEPMLILFDKTATAALRKYSVIQEVSKDEPFSLKAGGTIAFDDQVYTIIMSVPWPMEFKDSSSRIIDF